MTVSICPRYCSRRKISTPSPAPTTPPAIRTPPMRKSTVPRDIWVKTPDTLAPVTCDAADAAATVGGMP